MNPEREKILREKLHLLTDAEAHLNTAARSVANAARVLPWKSGASLALRSQIAALRAAIRATESQVENERHDAREQLAKAQP